MIKLLPIEEDNMFRYFAIVLLALPFPFQEAFGQTNNNTCEYNINYGDMKFLYNGNCKDEKPIDGVFNLEVVPDTPDWKCSYVASFKGGLLNGTGKLNCINTVAGGEYSTTFTNKDGATTNRYEEGISKQGFRFSFTYDETGMTNSYKELTNGHLYLVGGHFEDLTSKKGLQGKIINTELKYIDEGEIRKDKAGKVIAWKGARVLEDGTICKMKKNTYDCPSDNNGQDNYSFGKMLTESLVSFGVTELLSGKNNQVEAIPNAISAVPSLSKGSSNREAEIIAFYEKELAEAKAQSGQNKPLPRQNNNPSIRSSQSTLFTEITPPPSVRATQVPAVPSTPFRNNSHLIVRSSTPQNNIISNNGRTTNCMSDDIHGREKTGQKIIITNACDVQIVWAYCINQSDRLTKQKLRGTTPPKGQSFIDIWIGGNASYNHNGSWGWGNHFPAMPDC